MQSNSTTTKIISTKHKKLVPATKKVKSWKRDNVKRLPIEIY